MEVTRDYKQPAKVALLLNTYNYEIHKGIAHYAREQGWLLDDTMTREGYIPQNWEGDGIISFHGENPGIISKIISSAVPTVELGASGSLTLPSVLPDNRAIAEMGGKHLIDQGFEQIGYVVSSNNLNDQERAKALESVVTEASCTFQLFNYNRLDFELKKASAPVALMVENDYIAMMIAHKCLSAGYKIPSDIAILSVGNNELYCEQSPVTISSIDSNLFEIGYEAASLLGDMMSGKAKPNMPKRINPKNIKQRASTSLVSITHPHVAKALKHIQRNYRENIDFETLSVETGMCRRRLDDAFRRNIGRTMYEEQLRRRLEYAQRQLADSKKKIYAIAEESGFANSSHMTRLFKQHLDLTPKEVRRQRQQEMAHPY